MPCRQQRPSPALPCPGEFRCNTSACSSQHLPPLRCARSPRRRRASLGTNFSDQWWNPNESGWGASVLQQYDTLFFDLFVYGHRWPPAVVHRSRVSPAAKRPVLFSGDLYATSGPWFGSFFNPAAVSVRRVGTLQFDASNTDFATLTYSVDGVLVAKSIQRQLFAYEDFTGSYFGGFVYDQSNCANPANNGHVEELGSIQINHPPTIRSHSRSSRISARVRSRATTVNSVTWVRSTPIIHVRTASTAR